MLGRIQRADIGSPGTEVKPRGDVGLRQRDLFTIRKPSGRVSSKAARKVKCKLNFQSKERAGFGFRAFICFRESLIPFAIGPADF